MKKWVVVSALLGIGLLFTQFAWLTSSESQTTSPDFDQKVNLALRRTAHYLLREAGDSTTLIPAVQQSGETTFQLQLEHAFNYSRLPALLQQSLAVHNIRNQYDVAILDCQQGELVLGYAAQDVNEWNEVPCSSRAQKEGCYTIQLSFIKPVPVRQPVAGWWPWVTGLVLLSGAYLVWQKSDKKVSSEFHPATDSHNVDGMIHLSALSFNPANQTLTVANQLHTLTYRETKLLHLFLRHPNQLLDRDFILKSVWEDEGIIVGRSVDVFVSRLRKLLHEDPALHIMAVHGIGYRLEVQQQEPS